MVPLLLNKKRYREEKNQKTREIENRRDLFIVGKLVERNAALKMWETRR